MSVNNETIICATEDKKQEQTTREVKKKTGFGHAALNWIITGPARALQGTEAALVKRSSWNLSFYTTVNLLKGGAYAVPREITAIRLVTDHGIPGIVLPKGVDIKRVTLVESVTSNVFLDPVDKDVWHNSSSCDICQKAFHLITNKRHHCRYCGFSICQACSPGK